MALNIGDKAPDFEAKADSGSTVTLYEALKSGPVVLYFYPKDETPGCTAEACSFRDNWSDIRELGATVYGVSSDTVESHRKFKEHRNLPFTLLSDPERAIRKTYGATGLLLPPRITYVIDKDGTIVHVYNSQMNAKNHSAEALTALNKLAKKSETHGK
ncbi:MAG: peroxiredoxin [Thermoplasmataceae archaeon]